MSEEKIEIQKGSGNIFKDLEIPNPGERLKKVHLAFIIEDYITESGLRLEETAKILNLSTTKLSTLLDGLLDDFSVDDLSSLITTLKSLTVDSATGPIDRFFQWLRQVFRSLFPSPLAVGTAGFGVLMLIIGVFYLGSRYFDGGVSDTNSIARENGIVPVQIEPTFVKGVGKEVQVSPFGFGAFPEIPTDFPDQNIWNVVEKRTVHDPDGARTLELLARVRIKLWEQGKHTKGVIMDPSTKLIYPDSGIKITMSTRTDGDSRKLQYPASANGDLEQPQYDMYFDDGLIPQGWISVKFLGGSIDPYEFLNLPR